MTSPEDLHLDDPDAPVSEEEARAADELRTALEDPTRDDEGAALLRAAALAHDPRPLADAEHRAIVNKALAARSPASRSNVVRVVFGVGAASVVALAAGFVLFLRAADEPSTSAPPTAMAAAAAAVPLVPVRSTQPLFHEPFATTGGTSARIDRIALARETDLRDNQFTRWGVK